MKKLQLSASQFKMFKSCPRKHYFRYKEKIKEPTTIQNQTQNVF